MKKLTRLFFVFIFIIACLALFASCGETESQTEESSGLVYSYYDDTKTCQMNGLGECKDTKLVIPRSTNGYEVKSIYFYGDDAAEAINAVTEIVLHDGIEYVFVDRFKNLKFNEYENGKYLGTSDNPYYAFIDPIDRESASIDIHPDTKIFGYGALRGMKNLKEIVIHEGVTHVGFGAFAECSSLVSVSIPGTLKVLNDQMFLKCTSLKTVTLGDGVEIIYVRAFAKCSALESISIPDSVTGISLCAFEKCTSLTKLDLGNGIKTIVNSAFTDCENLTQINVPSSVELIGRGAFDGCDKLEYNKYENALYLGNEENPYVALVKATSTDINTINIHENTSAIAYYAFKNCENLRKVIIPEGVKVIGQGTFSNCSSLEDVELPSTITEIHSGAFSRCHRLRDIRFHGTKEQWRAMGEKLHVGWAEDSDLRYIYSSNARFAPDYK